MSILEAESFAEVVQSFLNYLEAKRRFSPYTISCYRSDLQQFCLFLDSPKDFLVTEIVADDLMWYLQHMQKQNFRPSTIGRKFSAIRSFFKFCKNSGFITTNPSDGLFAPIKKKRPPKFMSQDDVAKLLQSPSRWDNLGLRDKAILQCLYHTGLRVGELVRLNLADLDLNNAKIKVCGEWHRERLVPMPVSVINAIKKHLSGKTIRILFKNNTILPLFASKNGRRLSQRSINRMVKKYLSRSGLSPDFSPQTLRASFAIKMFSDGAKPEEVQHRLGNLSRDATRRYQHYVCC